MESLLTVPDVLQKIALVSDNCKAALAGVNFPIPLIPARDLQVLPISEHPGKKGLSYVEGQARLLHDLANIELQAMELAFRTLCEYPNAPRLFREQLADLTISEGQHLKLCLDGLNQLGFQWGTWPAHLALWEAISFEDSIIDRLFIVHRYLEGSGLDAGGTILTKLSGVKEKYVQDIVRVIQTEEIDHVNFGSYWYRQFCLAENLNPETDFRYRLDSLKHRLPRRLEVLNWVVRKKAGFTDLELLHLTELQNEQKAKIYKGHNNGKTTTV